MKPPNQLSCSKMFIMSAIAALELIYVASNWADECMATLADPKEYTLAGYYLRGDDNEVTTTIKPGERFIAAPSYYEGDKSWRVYLKSGIHGLIDRSRIRSLPEEPLMKLNFSASKQLWRKLRAKPVMENDEAAWQAKTHGINYYDTLLRASEGDLKAIARFDSLAEFMDGAALENYGPEWWALLHIAGDENFANYLKSSPEKTRKSYRDSFSISGSDATEPISKLEPYIKRHFPKSYRMAFGR
jgi:hypothetical protein